MILIQLAVLVAGALLILKFDAEQSAEAYVIGAAIVLVNLVLHAFVWNLLIHKKLIALAVTVIVFKYAILGAIIYKTLKIPWVSVLWFCVGVSSLLVTSVVYAVLKEKDVV